MSVRSRKNLHRYNRWMRRWPRGLTEGQIADAIGFFMRNCGRTKVVVFDDPPEVKGD